MIKKKSSSNQVDTVVQSNDQGLSASHQALSSYEQHHSTYTNNFSTNIYKENNYYKEGSTSNTLTNTKESLGGEKVSTTNVINENFTHNSNATINNYPES